MMTAAPNTFQKTSSLRMAKVLENTEQEVLRYRDALSNRISEMQKMASEINLDPIKKTVSIQQLRKRLEKLPRQIIRKPVWMDWEKLNEFANGSMAACFGGEFSVFENRRHPRIPRDRLMLMSRMSKVNGIRHELSNPAEIFGEYDLPEQCWFTSHTQEIALAAWMEAALQPCGVLSAHLGTALVHPEIDFYFRNLDGELSFSGKMPIPGETIQNYGKMTSTIVGADTILQRFDFSLSSNGSVFLQGNTVFGYFHPDAMAAQKGMESSERSSTLTSDGELLPLNWIHQRHGEHRAKMLSEAKLHSDGSLSGVYDIHEEDWFFQDHFLHDPVMPGSLGVEAAAQLLELYAAKKFGKNNTLSITVNPVINTKMKWKYRGQILPTDKQMKVFVDGIKEIPASGPNTMILQANAEIWKDALKIYEIENMQIQVAWQPDLVGEPL